MTLPDERYRSIKHTEQFLQRLAGGDIRRVPKAVREEARMLLRHYPSEYYLGQLSESRPDILQQQLEDLHRFVLQGEPNPEGERDN